MSNANMPAMPQSVSRSDDGAVISSCDFVGCEGLTKREYFAALAMQSIISSKHEEIKWWSDDMKQQSFAQSAVGYADLLLAELERTK